MKENVERLGLDAGDFLEVFRDALNQFVFYLFASSGKQVDVDDRHGNLPLFKVAFSNMKDAAETQQLYLGRFP